MKDSEAGRAEAGTAVLNPESTGRLHAGSGAVSGIFLIDDVGELRRKIMGLPPRWRRRWVQFLRDTRDEVRGVRWYGGGSLDRPLHASLAFLITGEDEFAAIARRDLRWMLDHHEETLAVGSQDHDTWIYAAALARRAISMDWIWVGDVLTEAEKSEASEFFITEAWKYCPVVLDHRVPAHASNQGLAMALCCVVTGWLFGKRLGSDARAKELVSFGLPHLLEQIALLPPGGYSGEGSTYIFNVADPLMALACAVLEAISGEDWFEREFWPNRNSASSVLKLDPKLIPPSELLPAWDQHGYHLRKAGSACAYVASRTGDPSAYRYFLDGPGWEFSGYFAWLRDDHVWQWIWMPDPSTSGEPESGASCYPRSWAESRVAGALLDRTASLHLFQMWDVSSPRPVRLHMNPNSLLLEAWGSLLTVDGNGTDDFVLNADPRMQYFHQYSAEPKTMSWAAGSLGAHSVIHVDGAVELQVDRGGYNNLPGETSTGFLLRREDEENFQLLSAEVEMFYRHASDIRSMVRNSALVDNAFWVVLDEISATSDHDFTWQLVLRAGAVATEYGARLVTPEYVILDVINLDSVATRLLDVDGYPSLLEKKCHHLQKTQRGSRIEFLTVLVPQLAREELADWTDGWQGGWEPREIDGPLESPSWSDSGFDEAAFGPADSALWLRRCCEVPRSSERLFLELPRPHGYRLWVDGTEQTVPPVEISKDDEMRLLPVFVDLTEALAGKASARITVRLEVGPLRGTTGRVRLHAARQTDVPKVNRLPDDRVRVRVGPVDYTFDLGRIRTTAAVDFDLGPAGEMPRAVAAKMIRRLSLDSDSPEVLEWNGDAAARGNACVAAVDHPLGEVEAALIERCDDGDWLVRMLAVRSLGQLRSRRSLPRILEILQAETPDRINDPSYPPKYRIKETCVHAVQAIGEISAAPALATAMENAGFYGVRRIIPGALEALGDQAAIDRLRPWLDDADGETADACRRALDSVSAPKRDSD